MDNKFISIQKVLIELKKNFKSVRFEVGERDYMVSGIMHGTPHWKPSIESFYGGDIYKGVNILEEGFVDKLLSYHTGDPSITYNPDTIQNWIVSIKHEETTIKAKVLTFKEFDEGYSNKIYIHFVDEA